MSALPADVGFHPTEPRTWEDLGTSPVLIEQLVLRYLLSVGAESGRNLSNDLCVAASLVKELLDQLKLQKFVQLRSSTVVGDFVYELTDLGRARAAEYRRVCAYVGPAPVPFEQYLRSVRAQSPTRLRLGPEHLEAAFDDLLIGPELLTRIGPALSAGRSLFLYGAPGNGKTSIAERLTRCYGDTIRVPHALWMDGHIVKLYDPAAHHAVEEAAVPGERPDRRWVTIERPTVVAGGELTLDMLELRQDPVTHIVEAPLQLKANGGTLVIDDFGRQRVAPQELLNRWIFPLERRLDYLRLPDGRTLTVPFDPILVFSTNLDPRQLVDEAFLRRIPYKVEVRDPTPSELALLIAHLAAEVGVELPTGAVEDLFARHYRPERRPMRYCHARDLLHQIVHAARFERRRPVATPDAWDAAVANYFGAG